MTIHRSLGDAGIKLRDWSSGNRKALCPKCSHTRRNKTDRCLSVTIISDSEAVWHCHHCGWSGGVKPNEFPAPAPKLSRQEIRRRKGDAWRRKFTDARAW